MLGAVVLSTVALLTGHGDPSASLPPPPVLTAPSGTVSLSRFLVSPMSCHPRAGCITADVVGVIPPARLNQRVRGPFRGALTLTVPEGTDSVEIWHGYQRRVAYTDRPTIRWKLPGSGTYFMWTTVKWHDAGGEYEATYAVPLWVPRAG